MTNIVVEKSTDQCPFVKSNMVDEFVGTFVGITAQLFYLRVEDHKFLVKSGTSVYSYHTLHSTSTSSL